PLEVDDAVHPLVPAAAEADADDALVVAAALLLEPLEQRLLGLVDLRVGAVGEVADRTAPAAGGSRVVLADAHGSHSCQELHRFAATGGSALPAPPPVAAKPLEELDLIFLVQFDDRLLPARQLADAGAVAALLAH